MYTKKLIPCIYLSQKMAVAGLKSDKEVVSTDPVKLAQTYFKNGADEIIVFDLSSDDHTHEEALDVIKAICTSVNIPVIGAGNVKRMEDIKKLLYAGCKVAALNFSKESNVELVKEVSLKFGKEKIAACVDVREQVAGNKDLINEYIGTIIGINEELCECKNVPAVKVPFIYMYPSMSIAELIDKLGKPCVMGISGTFANENVESFYAIKKLCIEKQIPINSLKPLFTWDQLKKNSDGMVPVVVQDYTNDEVLMVAYMDEDAYHETLMTGRMTYYSRSRKELWVKGLTSGHFQYVKSLTADCDMDTILAKVAQIGSACHTGSHSCFFNKIVETEYEEKNPAKILESVTAVIKDRKVNPKEGSYTNYLFDKGIDKILKKLGEEATEIVIAAKNPNANEVKYEISDFLYHMMVLMVEKNVSWEDITEELARR